MYFAEYLASCGTSVMPPIFSEMFPLRHCFYNLEFPLQENLWQMILHKKHFCRMYFYIRECCCGLTRKCCANYPQ